MDFWNTIKELKW